jgi:hypothetical protein
MSSVEGLGEIEHRRMKFLARLRLERSQLRHPQAGLEHEVEEGDVSLGQAVRGATRDGVSNRHFRHGSAGDPKYVVTGCSASS